ncbi:MAG: hypothetical protein AAF497_01890 [Planctomycetota bacterium]
MLAFFVLFVIAALIVGPGSEFFQELRDKIQADKKASAIQNLENASEVEDTDDIADPEESESSEDTGATSDEEETAPDETAEPVDSTDGDSQPTEGTESEPAEDNPSSDATDQATPAEEPTDAASATETSAAPTGSELQRVGEFTLADFKDAIVRETGRPTISARDLRTISTIPRTRTELETAHNRNKSNSCEIIAADGEFEVSRFTPFLTDRDSRRIGKGLILPSTRRHVFSVGLDMWRDDQGELPIVSRGQILGYLRSHYVSVQARVQRDPLDNTEFLFHRPLAATFKFASNRKTEAFTEAVIASLRDMRSLGVYLPPGAPRIPENLRTIVITHRNVMAGTGVKLDRARPDFELLFIRARTPKGGGSLELHAFGTTERREVLHYISRSRKPRRASDCGIKGTVAFTKYSHANLYPTEAVIRNSAVRSQSDFRMSDLNKFVQSLGLTGDALDNLNFVLDAMIDKKIIGSTRNLQLSAR